MSWLADVPGGSWLAAPVGRMIGTLLTTVQSLSVPQGAGDADALTRKAFGVPPTLENSLDAAEHVAGILKGWIPAGAATAAAPAAEASPQPETDDSAPVDHLLRSAGPTPEMRARLDQLRPVLADIAKSAAVVRNWTAEGVLTHMKELVTRLLAASPRAQALLAEFEAEALTLPDREALGLLLGATRLFPLTVAPSLANGRYVHEVLQQRYRAAHGTHLVVSERTVYGPEFPGGMNLKEAAGRTAASYADLTALQVARFSIFSSRGNLRDDLIDLYFGQPQGLSWEIKPVRGAALGVLQEMWYRFSYNAWAIFMEETLRLPMRTRKLAAGSGWNATPGLLLPFRLRDAPGVYAFPYAFEALPGLVLYSLVRAPDLRELAPLLAIALDALRRRLREAAKALEQLGEGIAKSLADAVESLGPNLVTALVVLAILFALVSLLSATLPVSGVMALGTALILLLGEAAETPGPRQAASRSEPRTVYLGSCRLEGISLERLHACFHRIGPLVAESLAALPGQLRAGEAFS